MQFPCTPPTNKQHEKIQWTSFNLNEQANQWTSYTVRKYEHKIVKMSSHSLCFLFFGNSGVSNKSKFHLKQVFHMMIAYSTTLNPYLNIFHLADLIFNLRFYRTLNFILSKCKNPKKNKRPIGHIIHLKNTSNFDLSKKLSLLNCCQYLPLWLLYVCRYTIHCEKKKQQNIQELI